MSIEHNSKADETERQIEEIRRRIFENGEYRALNNFSGTLPHGWQRTHLEQPDTELLETRGEDRLIEDLKFFGYIDDAIREAGLDFAVIIAFNIASAFSEDIFRDSPELYKKFKLGRARYIFPVYAILRRQGYSDQELCA